MKAETLLDIIGSARDCYVADAMAEPQAKHHLRLNRLGLIAALAAVALVLTGCVAVVLHLQDKKIGESTSTRQRDVYGNLVEPTQLHEDVIYPYAPADSPMQQAAREWHDYRFSPQMPDDWDMEMDQSLPENYQYIYRCYSWDMANKLDEIMEKYGLKLLEAELTAQSYQKDILHQALGIRSVVRSDAKAEVKEHYGWLSPDGTFSSTVFFTLTGEGAWDRQATADFYYAADGYFSPYYYYFSEEDTQWTYQTADGTTVLIAMQPSGQGTVFADVAGGSIKIDITPDLWPENPYPRSDSELPTRQVLEQMADIFDYHVSPQPFDLDSVKTKLDAREAEQQEKMRQPEYVGFEEFLDRLNHLEHWSYMMYDLNGDGRDEMILHGTELTFALQFHDDVFTEMFMLFDLAYPCEDGYLMRYAPGNSHTRESYQFEKVRSTPDPVTGSWFGQTEDDLVKTDSGWKHYTPENEYPGEDITDEQAQAVLAKYTRLDIPERPLLELPMNGTTLGQIIEARGEPDAADFRQICADFVTDEAHWMHSLVKGLGYYDIRDVNGDGSPELLLGEAPDTVNYIGTLDRWRIINLRTGGTLRLRADRVVENVGHGTYTPPEGAPGVPNGESSTYRFERLAPDGTRTDLGFYRYLKDTDSWIDDKEQPISSTAYQEMADKYPLVEVELKPIAELTGN